MSISDSYADQMIAARGQIASNEDEGFSGGALALPSGGAMAAPQGAVQVAVHRDEARILAKLKVMANAAGQRWYYRWPTKNRDGSKGVVEGPSIDCAMAVARLYGNCDVDLRVSETVTHWVFYARFRDFESGFTTTRAFQQRKSQTTGKMDAERQLDIVFQIGQSKAIRNVIVNALADFADFAFEAAKGSFVERIGLKIEDYRKRAVTRFGELGIDIRRVENVIGKASKDWLAPDIARIIAELQAIGDGMSSADETYPVLEVAVSEKEPVREEAKTTEAKPRQTRKKADAPAATDEKPAEEAKPEDSTPESSDFDAYIAEREAEAKAATSLSDLADIDDATSKALTTRGADSDVQRYWRAVVAGVSKELNGQGG
jgi:hypothetical protein